MKKLHQEDIGAICNRYMNLTIAYNVPRYNGIKRAVGTSYLKLKYNLNLTSKDVLNVVNNVTEENKKILGEVYK